MKTPFKESNLGQWLKKNIPTAVNVVENFAPAPIKGTIDTIKNLISNEPSISPEQKEEGLKLSEIYEQEFLASLGDVADARKREIAIRDNTPKVLAYSVTIGFFGLLSLLIFHVLPNECADIVKIMVGSLGTAWSMIVGYYFGSSAGSARKSETIDAMMAQK